MRSRSAPRKWHDISRQIRTSAFGGGVNRKCGKKLATPCRREMGTSILFDNASSCSAGRKPNFCCRALSPSTIKLFPRPGEIVLSPHVSPSKREAEWCSTHIAILAAQVYEGVRTCVKELPPAVFRGPSCVDTTVYR